MSFSAAGGAVCPRSLVPSEGPATVVIGAFAHGSVSRGHRRAGAETPVLKNNRNMHVVKNYCTFSCETDLHTSE